MTSMKNVQFLHPFPLFLFVRMGPNWSRPSPAPGRQNLGYQPPHPTIPFGILANNYTGKSPKYTQCKAVIYNEKQHVKSSNMSTVLILLL